MTLDHASIGPYQLVRKLGEGGMGAVYEALHVAIERRVAIKFLHPEYANNSDITKRFFNEARAVNRIEHPSLVQISDHGQLPDGTAYIVMEYLSGETLGHRLQRLGGRIPLPSALQISWQLAAALTAVHDKSIVHRDLKPENVMLVADPLIASGERVKILDFGIAKLVARTRETQGRTGTNAIMGTPMYMSPEQCRGAGIVDAKTDVYSLGVILFEMLAGRPPFVAEGGGELIGMQLFREPPPLQEFAPNIPSSLTELVHRLLVKDRDIRPSMRQVTEEIEKLIKVFGSVETSPSKNFVSTRRSSSAETRIIGPRSSTLDNSIGQQRRAYSLKRPYLLLVVLMGGGLASISSWLVLRPTRPTPSSVAPRDVLSPAQSEATASMQPAKALPISANGKFEQSVKSPILANEPTALNSQIEQPEKKKEALNSISANSDGLIARVSVTGKNQDQSAKQNKSNLLPSLSTPKTTSTLLSKIATDTIVPKELEKADRLYKQGQYKDAIHEAMSHQSTNSDMAWEIIGKSACSLKITDIASNAMKRLSAVSNSRTQVINACAKHGIAYRSNNRFGY